MSKGVGWAVGAAIVSITIGILVGLVLHTGRVERADRAPVAGPAAAGSSVIAAATRTEPTPPAPTASPVLTLSPSPASTLAPPSTSAPSTLSAMLSTVPPPPSAPPSSSAAATSSTGTSSAPATTTTTGGPPGPDAAGLPCPTLAARSSDAAGTTLYCQVDGADRTLRWRAVVDKGGCLNQSMTGTAADGLEYRCRLDASGRNHWAPAG